MSNKDCLIPCRVRTFADDGTVLVSLTGALRLQNSEALKNQLLLLIHPSVKVLQVYLGSITEIDSAGLGVLVGLHMTSRKHKIDFRLLSPTPYMKQLFETTRLNTVFQIVAGEPADAERARLERDPFERPLSHWEQQPDQPEGEP